MGIRIRTRRNKFPHMEATLRSLDGKRVTVGVKGEQAWLAGIHEYGCNITPKNARYLTVPCIPEARGRRASSFPDLFFYKAKSGSKWLARKKGDSIELVYALMDSVRIPERSFLRAGFDKCHMKAVKKAERLLPKVIDGRISEHQMYEVVGTLLRDGIKDYAVALHSPAKKNLTLAANPAKENPLVDTGDMINAIEFEVE